MKREFDIASYLLEANNDQKLLIEKEYSEVGSSEILFYETCKSVDERISSLEREEGMGKESEILERQRRAILGYEKETAYYKNIIREIIRKCGYYNLIYPKWYSNLESAFFGEILGFAGLTEWIEGKTEKLRESSSAKTIGDRIYFMIDGKLQLQPQRLSRYRRKQLRTALLLRTPEKRAKDGYHEVYLTDGTRVTLYNEGFAKTDQDALVFRKFLIKNYTFEEQAERGTIPPECIHLFKEMVKIGYNVAFIGAVKTAKTTFLTTWQSYEEQSLEGVMVESDPEIPLHEIMPAAPIMQFIPSNEDLPFVVKKILRSDADYIIMAEARDGIALNTAVKAANKGTRRVKMTFHTTDPIDFCYDVADEIANSNGSPLGTTITKVAKSFHFLFQFMQLSDKSKKRLKAIWEIRYDLGNREVSMHQICKYQYESNSWSFSADIGKDKEEIGHEENKEAYERFLGLLKQAAGKHPMQGKNSFLPSYNSFIKGGKE